MAVGLTAEVVDGADKIGAGVWNRLVAATDAHANPFLAHAFFLAIEDSGCATKRTGWSPHHLVLRRGEEIGGLLPMYENSHAQGEYVFDHGWANAFEQAGGRYYPKLQSAVPFTPVTAPKLLTNGEPDIGPALLAAAANYVDGRGISSLCKVLNTTGRARTPGYIWPA